MTRTELLAVAKPILFNTQMVRAILDERKTVTRRVIKYSCHAKPESTLDDFIGNSDPQLLVSCAPYQSGDLLYVRETWCEFPLRKYHYKADWGTDLDDEFYQAVTDIKWRPSIHMPKEAARLFLRVTGVQVERLQDITPEQCCQEGIAADFPQPKPSYLSLVYAEARLKPALKSEFAKLWDSTIKSADLPHYGWGANPWVWVIEFERCEPEGGTQV